MPNNLSEFAHLRYHSHFSMTEGLGDLDQMMALAKQRGIWAMALTDTNLFGYVKFYNAALRQGIKPICGVELNITLPWQKQQVCGHITLLVSNDQGYKNLCRIVTDYNLAEDLASQTLLENLRQDAEGLIALSGGAGGIIETALAQDHLCARDISSLMLQIFDHEFYYEINMNADPAGGNSAQNAIMVDLAQALDIKCVATNNVFFPNQQDFEAHAARVQIVQSTNISQNRHQATHYLKSNDQMRKDYDGFQILLENANQIAKKCNFQILEGIDYMPKISSNSGESPQSILSSLVYMGLQQNLNLADLKDIPEEYKQRAEVELDVIGTLNYPDYFLVMHEMIQFANQNDIPIGPGRGSAAGSLISWALGITSIHLDPLKYGLLFERFLNIERVSMPDIDIDICSERRDELIQHVSQTFGKDHVAQIAAIGTMGAKMSIKDVARHLGRPALVGKKIADMIPLEVDITIDKAMETSQALRECHNIEEDKEIIDLAIILEGTARNMSKHAAGIVIAPKPLKNFLPLYIDEDTKTEVTQYDNRDLERLGFVKFDLLGLSTLTLIDKTIKLINHQAIANDGEKIILNQIPLADPEPYKLIATTSNVGIFQLENPRMQSIINSFAAENLEELAALLALIRPGPLTQGMVDMAIKRKHQTDTSSSNADSHPLLDKHFPETWGMLIYQEQVMEIARKVAGYSYGEADVLRRAMGKKDAALMQQQKIGFVSQAKDNNIDENDATKLYELIEKFAGYGFNKSHSMGYALLSYWSAWLKKYYPNEFFTIGLQHNSGKDNRMRDFAFEAQKLGCVIAPPCINHSDEEFSFKDGRIYYGLAAIKGMVTSAAQIIVAERERNGQYSDLFDLCKRVNPNLIGNSSFETLIKSGALSSFGTAGVMSEIVPKAMVYGENYHATRDQIGMFDTGDDTKDNHAQIWSTINVDADWSAQKYSILEQKTLGYNICHHPVVFWEQILSSHLSALKHKNTPIALWRLDDLYLDEGRTESRYRLQLSTKDNVEYIVRRKSDIDKALNLFDETLAKNMVFLTKSQNKNSLISLRNYLAANFNQLTVKLPEELQSATRIIRSISNELTASKGKNCIKFSLQHKELQGDFMLKSRITQAQWIETIELISQYVSPEFINLTKVNTNN